MLICSYLLLPLKVHRVLKKMLLLLLLFLFPCDCASLFRQESFFLLPSLPNVRPLGYIFVCRILSPPPIFLPISPLLYHVRQCPLEPPSVSKHLYPSVSARNTPSSSVLKEFRRHQPVPLWSYLLLRGFWFSQAQHLVTIWTICHVG